MHKFFALAGLLLAGSVVSAQELRVGAAAVKITPPLGIGMAGYYFERGAEGTHDDLYAKAIVLQQGDTRVALVGLDLISTTRQIVEEARAEIEKSTGIPGRNVMISATHAHTGPVLAKRGAREDISGGAANLSVTYSNSLPGLIAQAVKAATTQPVAARALTGMGREEHLSFSRRFIMNDGTVGWNPGKLNPKIVKPTGPVDPDVGVVLFESAPPKGPGKAIATYVSFALHADTTGGNLFSADYPGVLSRLLAACKGEEMITLFANGACGNVNHVDVTWSDRQHGYNEACRIGTVLAADVIGVYRQMQPVQSTALQVRSQLVSLPLPAVTAEEAAKAKETAEKLGMKDNRGFMDKVRAYRALDVAGRQGKPQEVEVQVITLGDDVAWVSLPGEVFSELGLAIKKASPFRYTMLAELANGSIGYIPDRKAYTEGNYEPESARCAAGSGEMLVDAAVKMLNELKQR
jgi:neutral ceramidase